MLIKIICLIYLRINYIVLINASSLLIWIKSWFGRCCCHSSFHEGLRLRLRLLAPEPGTREMLERFLFFYWNAIWILCDSISWTPFFELLSKNWFDNLRFPSIKLRFEIRFLFISKSRHTQNLINYLFFGSVCQTKIELIQS